MVHGNPRDLRHIGDSRGLEPRRRYSTYIEASIRWKGLGAVRRLRPRLVGAAVLAALLLLLAGGCELREGVKSEYGGAAARQVRTISGAPSSAVRIFVSAYPGQVGGE